jgi:hypothetical protein
LEQEQHNIRNGLHLPETPYNQLFAGRIEFPNDPVLPQVFDKQQPV